MTLASIADVKRYIPGGSTLPDTEIQPFLDSADEWAIKILGALFEGTSQIEEFTHVRQGQILVLGSEVPTSIVVTGFLVAGSTGEILEENSTWFELPEGKIEILFWRLTSPTGLPEAVVEKRPLVWQKISIAYNMVPAVPTPVREAVAMIAAAGHIDATAGTVAGDIISERLGDYSYSREASGSKLVIPAKARTYMRPYNRRLRIRST